MALTKREEDALRRLRDHPLQTREELEDFIVGFLDVHLASKPLTSGFSCPLDFVWDIYKTAMLDSTTGVPTAFLGLAARGAQKTLSCSVIIMLLLLHDRIRDIIHMASIAPQSEVLHNVWLTRHKALPFMEEIFKDFSMRRTTTIHNRRLTITWGTMDAVNAHHGGVLIQDEVDLTDPAVFDESKGMLTSQKGKSPLNVMISSRKYAVGNIQNILDKAEEDKNFASTISIHNWGQLETTRKCYDVRSGKYGTEIMVDLDNLDALSVSDWSDLGQLDKNRYQRQIGYENCLRCGIFSFCLGRLKEQHDNIHLTPINDVVKFFKNENREFFKSQRLNYKPSTKGLIYPTYDPKVHDKSSLELARIITGDNNLNIDGFKDLMDIIITGKLPLYIGVDFGFNNAAAVLLTIKNDKESRPMGFVLDELALSGFSDREFALETYTRWGFYPIVYIFPDVASPGGIKEFKEIWGSKTGVCTTTNKDVEYGININRNLLLWPGTMEPHLFFNKDNCHGCRQTLRNYRYKIDTKTTEPIDKVFKFGDHLCYTPDHEVLTLTGWKSIDGVTDSEPIMAVTEDGKYFYEKPQKWIKKLWDGNIIECKHNFGVLFKCTEDHPIADNGQYNTKRAHKIGLTKRLYRDLRSVTYIPCAPIDSSKVIDNPALPSWAQHDPEAFFWFLGFWLGDGTVAANRKAVKIVQSKKKHFQEISEKFRRLFKDNNIYEWDHHQPNPEHLLVHSWQVHHKDAYQYFKNMGKMQNKAVPQELLNAPSNYLWELLDGLIKADGSIYQGYRVFNSSSKRLVDQAQEICVRLGIYSRLHLYKQSPSSFTGKIGLPVYRLTISNKARTYNIPKDKFSLRRYSGWVHSPRTSSGYFLIRHNGSISIVSNCDAIRYPFATLLGTTPFSVSFGDEYKQDAMEQTVVSINGAEPLVRAPTGQEMLQILGTNYGVGESSDDAKDGDTKKKFNFSF